VIVWLTPAGEPGSSEAPLPSKHRYSLTQANKTFEPHILVIPVGAQVEFPNKDPFFHNVFSLFEGKRFDLGLYESGSTRSLSFDRPGISYLFCNIHSEMSAVIITLDTHYYATSDRAGQVTIPDVHPGRYILHVWREGSTPSTLKSLSRLVVVSPEPTSFGRIAVPDNGALPLTHKNKYGQDYEQPTPPGGAYRPR
jgi:plastocyanin